MSIKQRHLQALRLARIRKLALLKTAYPCAEIALGDWLPGNDWDDGVIEPVIRDHNLARFTMGVDTAVDDGDYSGFAVLHYQCPAKNILSNGVVESVQLTRAHAWCSDTVPRTPHFSSRT